MIRNVNSGLAEQILSRIGDEAAFFRMSEAELSSVLRLPRNVISEQKRKELLERAEAEKEFILANNIEATFYKSANYPGRLAMCEDGPAMIYQLGSTNLESAHVVSIVGTRNATPHGIEITRRIVRELAENVDNTVIVSGLAYGIDVAAHKAALEYGLPTVAVSAHPLNTVYPADHRGVAVNMLRNGGAMVTEYSTSHDIHKGNFLARNRIIAGLSDVTIVVESDSHGGSLVTAGLALAYNRDVYAVPGRLTDKYSAGTNRLIAADKARIFVGVPEMIEQLGWETKNDQPVQQEIRFELSADEQTIYDFLQEHPASRLNEIMIATNIPASQLKECLFNMEMRDIVMSMAGGKYSAL